MHVFRTVEGLRRHLHDLTDKSVGFTPTMGALHEGHLSLLHASKKDTDISVVSIFVNPTQFNDPNDLEKYPRDLNRDLELLAEAECDVVFVPEVDEVYPKDQSSEPINLNGLDLSMEGYFRPGHFAGVAQVVKRLLDIVEPQMLFMGQKDFQQVAVIAHLIRSLNLPVQLVMCPTMREESGLAMSSRNVRLDASLRDRAKIICDTLSYAKSHLEKTPIAELQEQCIRKLSIPDFRPEYFDIVDGHTLHPADQTTQYVVACCAVWAGEVRLIDNMILKMPRTESAR